MVPFELELELENNSLTVSVEQLDHLADEEGYIRFDVRTGERRGVIYVNLEDQVGTEKLLEAISMDEDFTTKEVRAIGNAIRQYNHQLRFMFSKFMDRSIFPEL